MSILMTDQPPFGWTPIGDPSSAFLGSGYFVQPMQALKNRAQAVVDHSDDAGADLFEIYNWVGYDADGNESVDLGQFPDSSALAGSIAFRSAYTIEQIRSTLTDVLGWYTSGIDGGEPVYWTLEDLCQAAFGEDYFTDQIVDLQDMHEIPGRPLNELYACIDLLTHVWQDHTVECMEDSYVASAYPNTNYGSESELFIKNDFYPQDGVLQFAEQPTHIYVYVDEFSHPSNDFILKCWKMEPFDENTVTWNNVTKYTGWITAASHVTSTGWAPAINCGAAVSPDKYKFYINSWYGYLNPDGSYVKLSSKEGSNPPYGKVRRRLSV